MKNLDSGLFSTSTPLHIVEIVDSLESGGAQALIGLRARFAAQMGYRIDVITLGEGQESAAVLIENGVTIHSFPSQHVFSAGRIYDICRLLGRLKPDVIHTHLRMANIVGSLCGAISRIPVVATLHGGHPEPEFPNPRREWAERWALRLLAKSIMAVGPSVARSQQTRFGGKKVHTVPNPVELPETDTVITAGEKQRLRRSLNLPIDTTDDPVVLIVGRLIGNKGFPQAFEVMQVLQKKLPQAKMLVAGDGELLDELQTWIDEQGMSDSIALLGRSEKVSELMLASDVLLLASEREGLPLVVLEAMAHRLPVVATAVGDVGWLLREGALGALVEWNDIEGTADSVYNVLSDKVSSTESAKLAQRRVADDFSIESWLMQLDNFYRAFAAGKQIVPGNSTGATDLQSQDWLRSSAKHKLNDRKQRKRRETTSETA